MKLKGSSYFYMVIMFIMLVAIGLSLNMEYFESKLLPLLIGSIVLLLSGIGLWREILAEKKAEATVSEAEPGKKEEAAEGWRGYLIAGAWVVGFFLGIWLVGFIVAIPLFVLAYMIKHGTRWYTSVAFAVVATAFVYGVFELALRVELYRGLIPTMLTY